MNIIQEKTKNEIICHTNEYKTIGTTIEGFHWHENIEICRVIENPCRFRANGVLINANPGDIVVFNEQSIHQFLIDIPGTKIQIFHLSPKSLLSTFNSKVRIKLHITREEIYKSAETARYLNTLFDMLSSEYSAVTTTDNPYMTALAASTYLFLQKQFPADLNYDAKANDREDFYRITEYINTHFCEDINVNEISNYFYFSRSKVSRIFKKYAGTGINEYINALRINKAGTLISQGLSITEAAFASGFNSIRTFNNTYKAINGKSPSEHLKTKQS